MAVYWVVPKVESLGDCSVVLKADCLVDSMAVSWVCNWVASSAGTRAVQLEMNSAEHLVECWAEKTAFLLVGQTADSLAVYSAVY